MLSEFQWVKILVSMHQVDCLFKFWIIYEIDVITFNNLIASDWIIKKLPKGLSLEQVPFCP